MGSQSKVTKIEKTEDDVKVFKSRSEKYRASSYAVNVGLGIYHEVFKLDIGVAGSKMRHSDTITASSMASFKYERSKTTI